MARSLNRVTLIGNLTRDPELRYTPQGTAVCTLSVATNRQWKTDSGDTRDDAEFHRIVAWDKLAEICSQLLGKGKRVFVEGRLQTRRWQTKEGQDRTTTEIVISDMILLERAGERASSDAIDVPEDFGDDVKQVAPKESKPKPPPKTDKKETEADDDIPF